MADLIDRDALEIDAWERLSDAVCALEKAPAVDAVEVVRCKDCKSWTRHSGVAKYSPTGLCSTWADTTLGVDFCSNGERRDNA